MGQEVEQCLCLLNAVCENLLAAHLIRARLRQQGSDYHYKNPQALQQTEAFIEQSLLSFLQGMYGERMNSDSKHAFLRKRLELNSPAYKRWLTRAAVEVLTGPPNSPLKANLTGPLSRTALLFIATGTVTPCI